MRSITECPSQQFTEVSDHVVQFELLVKPEFGGPSLDLQGPCWPDRSVTLNRGTQKQITNMVVTIPKDRLY